MQNSINTNLFIATNIPVTCTYNTVSQPFTFNDTTTIVDLSGNNLFYATGNLTLANHLFLNPNNTCSSNVSGKVQLPTSQTGIEFYNNFLHSKHISMILI